jgi:hypothetical protein
VGEVVFSKRILKVVEVLNEVFEILSVVAEREVVEVVVRVSELGDEAVENCLKQVVEYLLETNTDLMNGL